MPTVPAASDAVVMASAAPTLIVQAWVAAPDCESFAWNVTLYAPAAFGTPVIAPDPGFRFRPGGNCPPDTDHEYGGAPPVALNDDEYAWPATALADGHPVIAIAALILIDNCCCADETPSVTDAVKVYEPAVVGVPAMVAPE